MRYDIRYLKQNHIPNFIEPYVSGVGNICKIEYDDVRGVLCCAGTEGVSIGQQIPGG